MSSIRIQRIQEEIRKVVSELVIRGLRDPLPGFVTINSVEVSPDLSLAQIYYSVFGTDEECSLAQKVLDNHKGMFRSAVAKKVQLRHTPEIRIVLDKGALAASRVNELLSKLSS